MNNDAETEIHAHIQRWLEGVKAGDAGRIREHYAEDIVAFDAVMQLQFKGRDAYMKHWNVCFELCPGPHLFEMADTVVDASDDLAFFRSLLKCGYIDEEGTEKSSWMRVTACYRKSGGRWQIVHEHFSAPFDPESGKAIFDATP